jgi:hypothetical protein
MHSKLLFFSYYMCRQVKFQNLQILVTECIYTSHVRLIKRRLFPHTSLTTGLYDHRSVSTYKALLRVASLSVQTPGFDPTPLYVRFTVDKVERGQNYSPSNSVVPCQCYSTDAPYSSST